MTTNRTCSKLVTSVGVAPSVSLAGSSRLSPDALSYSPDIPFCDLSFDYLAAECEASLARLREAQARDDDDDIAERIAQHAHMLGVIREQQAMAVTHGA